SAGRGPAAEGRVRLADARASAPPVSPDPPEPAVPDEVESVSDRVPAGKGTATSGPLPSYDELVGAWSEGLLEQMSRKGRARFSAGRFIAVEDGTAVMGLPNEPHRKRCEDLRGELEVLLAARFGSTVPVRLVVDDGSTGRVSSTRSTPEPRKPQADDEVDLSALVDADAVEGSAVERLTNAFPGAALVDPD
ncbi:MAG: hypothetical protein QF844_06280, partial [Acidimicrobiales bacterium]|nr:hypothetical protein [Acidimicrobiales bacterium]